MMGYGVSVWMSASSEKRNCVAIWRSYAITYLNSYLQAWWLPSFCHAVSPDTCEYNCFLLWVRGKFADLLLRIYLRCYLDARGMGFVFLVAIVWLCLALCVKKGKGIAVPLQAWSGPDGSRKLRFPDFMTTAQDGGKVSFMHRPPLPPGNTPGAHFC